jgi:hypothetical protein
VSRPRHNRRWVMWLSVLGLALTLALCAWSEFNALSYRENTWGVANRLLLHRSFVAVTYRPGKDNVILTGLEMSPPGWSIAKFVPRDFGGWRRWVPRVEHVKGGIGEFWLVDVPLWMPVALFGVGVWWGQRGARVDEGGCAGWGFDVCGVVGGKCPECGRATTTV